MAAQVNEVRGQNHERQQLQELRLPVFQRLAKPFPDVVLVPEDRRLAVRLRLCLKIHPARMRLRGPADREQSEKLQAEPISPKGDARFCFFIPA